MIGYSADQYPDRMNGSGYIGEALKMMYCCVPLTMGGGHLCSSTSTTSVGWTAWYPKHTIAMSSASLSMPTSDNKKDVLCLGSPSRIVKGVGNERFISLALLYETAYARGNLAD